MKQLKLLGLLNNKDLVIIKSDFTVSYEQLKTFVTLDKLQEAVEGPIELLPNNHVPGYHIFVNEEGMRFNLNFNQMAYYLLGQQVQGNVLFIKKEYVK